MRNNMGRLPGFLRVEADRIKNDPRSDEEVARHMGVHVNTIKRVRQKGVWRDKPYVARDEIDREAQRLGLQPLNPNTITPQHPGQIGRPFRSGRGPITPRERQQIIDDPRKPSVVARLHGISYQHVFNIRRGGDRSLPLPLRPLSSIEFDRVRFGGDDPVEAAALYPIHEDMARAIQDGAFKDDGPVTIEGNDDAFEPSDDEENYDE